MLSPPPRLLPLIAILTLGHVAVSGGRVVATLFALKSGAGDGAAGLIIGLYAILPALFSLQFGRWIDRFGPRRVSLLGIALILTGILAPVAVLALPTIYLSALLCGCGLTLVTVSVQFAVGSLPVASEAERVGLFGWMSLGFSTSAVIGPSVAGSVIDLAGPRAAFAVLALACCSTLALVSRLPADPRSVQPAASGKLGAGWRGLLGDAGLRRIYIVTAANAVAWDAFTFLGPVLGHHANLSATAIGAMMSSFALGTFLVRLVIPAIAHRIAQWVMIGASLLLVAAVYLILPFVSWTLALFALAFALGAGVGSAQPNVLALLHRYAPVGRIGEAIGLRSLFGNLSGAGVPWIFGLSAASAGLLPVCWAIAATSLLGAWWARRG
ncbi:MFS transporter [Niveibacterium terrae]|uniref:MFS transporter n=1 Tax=Niveibacterium terrae TaxID=3373598 RepID=UPI003A93CD39